MDNQKLQTKNSFQLSFDKLPNALLNLQLCPIPSISLSHSAIGTPFSFIKEPDTRLVYSSFDIQFKLSENFAGYLEIFNWINGLGFPESFEQYSDWKGTSGKREKIFSDSSLMIMTATNNPSIRVDFTNMFPTALSEIEFDTTVQDATYIDVSARFEFDYMRISNNT